MFSRRKMHVVLKNEEIVVGSTAVCKPLLRGWLHALAAVAAVIFTVFLCLRSRTDLPRLLSLLIYGLSMIELYTVSALYHIGTWSQRLHAFLRALDHANIFLFIAGTYTPLCFNLLSGWLRPALLLIIWSAALLGMSLGVLILQAPRWLTAGLYVIMGWVVLVALPAFLVVVPWTAIAWLFLGGMLYTVGALIYARRWPDPFPRMFGFHELFHLFVLAGGVAFAIVVWIWAGAVIRG
jgi:hemolysin III